MKKFSQLKKGDTLYYYYEDSNITAHQEVLSVIKDSRFPESIYINSCCLDKNKSVDDYSQQKHEGYRTFYGTSLEALKPIIVENIKRLIEDKSSHVDMLLKEIESLKLNLRELNGGSSNDDKSQHSADQEKFESIWVEYQINFKHKALYGLPDDEYIEYKKWENLNMGKMLKKHFPTKYKQAEEVFMPHKGSELIFHGGCLGCNSQILHGIDRCKGCMYFKAQLDNPNLHC